MQAIVHSRYGPPDALELKDIDTPVVTDDQVLVRVHAAAVGKGDWLTVQGLPYVARLRYGLPNPKHPVPGFDVAGRIEAVGSHVTQLQPGAAVFGWCDGSFAEYASVPQGQLVGKPANLSFEQAAAVPISGFAALQALRDVGQVQAGQRVLVLGAAGGVGSYAVQLAKAFGARVTGVASTRQLELVRSLGADDVVDYTREDVTDGSRHWDLVIDTGGHRPLSRLRRALTPRGTLVIVGSEGRGRWLGGFDRNPPGGGAVTVRGPAAGDAELQDAPGRSPDPAELLEAGKVTPAVSATYPLAEVPEAIRQLVEGHRGGKLVITV